MASPEIPLDEVQWRHPQLADSMQGIHSNSVLFYFAESPFFDKTSNNAVIANQAMFNPAMYQYIQTREAFEGRLKTMSGVEFVVAEQPAQMAPGTGTGVWVIRKQTRRKRPGGDDKDEIMVHASYYVVGYNIYMAPTVADILGFRMATITSSLRKAFPAADEARTWSPARGHSYKTLHAASNTTTALRDRPAALSKEATPMPADSSQQQQQQQQQASRKTPSAESKKASPHSIVADALLAEHSFAVQMQYGGEYMDENPITGKPGEFHLSSTGRKERVRAPQLNPLTTNLKTPMAAPKPADKKEGNKEAKTPKTPNSGVGKLKRRKTKTGLTPGATPS